MYNIVFYTFLATGVLSVVYCFASLAICTVIVYPVIDDTHLGDMSEPCCIREPIVNQRELRRENWFSKTSGWSLQGCGLSHSYGLNLRSDIHAQITTQPYATRPVDHSCPPSAFIPFLLTATFLVLINNFLWSFESQLWWLDVIFKFIVRLINIMM